MRSEEERQEMFRIMRESVAGSQLIYHIPDIAKYIDCGNGYIISILSNPPRPGDKRVYEALVFGTDIHEFQLSKRQLKNLIEKVKKYEVRKYLS